MLGGEDSDGVYDDTAERFLLENSKPAESSPIEEQKPMGNETQENLKLMDEINELPSIQ